MTITILPQWKCSPIWAKRESYKGGKPNEQDAAYLHGASQWDGDYAPIAENGTAVYIFMAEHDEYYGSQRAWSAYNSLHDAYEEAGWSEEQISNVLQIQTPNDEWFAQRGVTSNYHGGGNVVFGEYDVLNWVLSHTKEENES